MFLRYIVRSLTLTTASVKIGRSSDEQPKRPPAPSSPPPPPLSSSSPSPSQPPPQQGREQIQEQHEEQREEQYKRTQKQKHEHEQAYLPSTDYPPLSPDGRLETEVAVTSSPRARVRVSLVPAATIAAHTVVTKTQCLQPTREAETQTDRDCDCDCDCKSSRVTAVNTTSKVAIHRHDSSDPDDFYLDRPGDCDCVCGRRHLAENAPQGSPGLSASRPRSATPAAPTTESVNHSLTCDSADRNPASNFPSRPLHLQTLSPNTNTGHVHSIDVPDRRLLPHLPIHPPLLASPSSPDRNEPVMAVQRRIWVRRPGASATRVDVDEDDLVDNVRDVILRKYANSLGRHIDSPDITLKIASREQANKNVSPERLLGPEESISKTLDAYYPGGQTIEEALIIEVPQRRTPKPSPRPGNHHLPYLASDDYRPGDGAREYFPPMPLHSPQNAHIQLAPGPNGALPVHSMSILTTGQAPPLPSPGAHSRPRHVRPKYVKQHTSSPTIIHTTQSNEAKTLHMNTVAAPAPPLPTPPPTAGEKAVMAPINRTTSPHSVKPKKKRTLGPGRDVNGEPPLPTKPASANLLDGRVPPINVLLVEDNVINLKLLEQFMKRLKVRWKSAMNGREAVDMWRKGGFHLVLMDIQLPVMNGLEATKEIRRLESINGIGLSVFGDASAKGNCNGNGQVNAEDELEDRDLFKSPVIIVALTASSLQSDRHEALAVGCNDFLTKPVSFVWMERKVTEWGCMQALIDFNGWRKWKEIAEKKESGDPELRKQEDKEEKAKAKAALKAMFTRPPPSTKKEGSSESILKRTDTSSSSGGPGGSGAGKSTEQQLPYRRSHKSNRSQSGSLGTQLGTTVEVDEKEG